MLKALLTKAEYDAITSADVKKEYKAQGDMYVIDVQAVNGWSLEDVSALRGTIQAERTTVTNLTNTLKAFDGLDPVKVRDQIKQAETILADPTKKNLSEAERKSLTEQLEQKHLTEMTTVKSENDFFKAQVEKVLKENTALTAITDAKGNAKLLLPIVMSAIRVDKSGNDLVPRIYDEKGQVKITQKPGSTEPMSVKEYVELMKANPDYQAAFSANQMSGGGSSSSNGTKGAGSPGNFLITPEIARNPREYQRVSEAAKAAGQPVTFSE